MLRCWPGLHGPPTTLISGPAQPTLGHTNNISDSAHVSIDTNEMMPIVQEIIVMKVMLFVSCLFERHIQSLQSSLSELQYKVS